MLKILFTYIFDKVGILVLIPHPTAIGNCSEEIHEALKIANLRKKKILLILPIYIKNKLIPIKTINPKIFSLESNLFIINPMSMYLVPLRLMLWMICLPIIIIAHYYNLLGFQPIEKNFAPYFGTYLIFSVVKNGKIRFFNLKDSVLEKNLRSKSRYYDLRTTEKINKISQRFKKQLGMSEKDWHICLHVRTSGFYNDSSSSNIRNADICNYEELIKEVIKKGGWVFRLGDDSMPPIKKEFQSQGNRIVDMPNNINNIPEVNTWLIANCNVYVGMQSGPLDLARLFRRPIIMTNMYSPFFTTANEAEHFGIYKIFINRNNELEENILNILKYAEINRNDFAPIGYDYRELSSKEIVDFCLPLIPFNHREYKVNSHKVSKRRQEEIILKRIEEAHASKNFTDETLFRWTIRSIT